jgi:ectoine hydroxylase-related dioxygenase (phytanoyl-CoA dioxygenase family)
MRLTRAQVEAFHENGYLVVENALSPEDLDPLIADFETLIDDIAEGLYTEGKIEERYADLLGNVSPG